jgi:hypothetical protein
VIVPPRGWRSEEVGEKVKLTSPDGVAAGAFSYRERMRPVRSVLDLIRAGPPPPGFTVTRTEPIREVVTGEGESGAIAFAEGRIGGAPALLGFGFVFLDDFHSSLRGVVLEPDRFERFRATLEALVVGDAHMLGRVRRRHFRYAAPAGWTERGGLFVSRWLAPGHPTDPRAITVGPALPRAPGLSDAILGGVLGDADPARAVRAPRRSISTARGLHGDHWHLELGRADAPIEAHVVILRDVDFVYGVRLDTRPPVPPELDLLDALLESIRPVPPVAGAAPERSDVLRHWAD